MDNILGFSGETEPIGNDQTCGHPPASHVDI